MSPDSSEDMLASGRSLDSRFTLLRPLGKGGMGEAWLVRDEDLREELVAKIVPRDASGDLLALLQRECRHARRLRHPNIVQVFDFHRGDEHSFVTMAFVDGESLDRLRGKPLAEILLVARAIADSLAYAHGQGVVHRDLTSANVMLDAAGTPHLLDFGIAALTSSAESEDLTVTGGGSRHSVSPQQLDGETARPADDVYALGVLIYELITGRPPFWPDFDAEDVRSTPPAPMVSNHPIPTRLAALVTSMLGKQPGERPADMSVVVAELDAVAAEIAKPAEEPPRLTAPPRLTPPPRPGSRPPALTPPPAARPATNQSKPSAIEPPGTIRPELPARPASASPTAVSGSGRIWITAAVFGLLGVSALAVFLLLPDWVRSRQNAADSVELVAAAEAAEEASVQPEAPSDAISDFGDEGPEPSPTESAATNTSSGPELEEFEPVQPTTDLRTAEPPAAEPAPSATRQAAPVPQPTGKAAGEFEQAMSEGLAALDRADYAAARAAFSRAAGLRPEAPQSADGLARAETGLRLESIQKLRQQATGFEQGEDWSSAVKSYQQVLELDPTVEFALNGLDRSRARAALSASLDRHLKAPERLSAEKVLQEASAILGEASAIEPAGPRLRKQIADLTATIDAYSTPVRATFESDSLTEVVIYRVGKLGTFQRRDLELRPGTYTVVGSRRGYRDVRRTLVIEPGVEPQPLNVRCHEAI